MDFTLTPYDDDDDEVSVQVNTNNCQFVSWNKASKTISLNVPDEQETRLY